MMNAGTPCPIDGKIGEQAKELWEQNPSRQPKNSDEKSVTANRKANEIR